MKKVNEATFMIKIRCGKRTPFEVSGYYYGENARMDLVDGESNKEDMMDMIRCIIENHISR